MSKRLRSSFRPRKARSLKPRTGRPSVPTGGLAAAEGVEAVIASAVADDGSSELETTAEPAAATIEEAVAEAVAPSAEAVEQEVAAGDAEPAAGDAEAAATDEPAAPASHHEGPRERATVPELVRADGNETGSAALDVEEATRTTEPSLFTRAAEPSSSDVASRDVGSETLASSDLAVSDVRPGVAASASDAHEAAPPESEPKSAEPKSAKKAQAAAPKSEPRSTKSARGARDGHDHEDDPSATSMSLSADFFRMEEESVPPLVDADDHDDVLRAPPPSAETVARRARFRRVVGAIVGIAGILSIAVVGKAVASRGSRASLPPPPKTEAPAKVAAATLEAPKPTVAPAEPAKAAPAEEAKAAPAPTEEAKPAPVPSEEPKAADAKAAPVPSDEPKAAEAKPAEPAGEALSEADIKKLKKEAESLLNRGKRAEAIEAAKKAIAADPADALPYLLMGSALQDSGKWKDGIEAYSECVRHATKGPVHECRAMGGKK